MSNPFDTRFRPRHDQADQHAEPQDNGRSFAKRDISRLPLNNLEDYRHWCDQVSDEWTDD